MLGTIGGEPSAISLANGLAIQRLSDAVGCCRAAVCAKPGGAEQGGAKQGGAEQGGAEHATGARAADEAPWRAACDAFALRLGLGSGSGLGLGLGLGLG